MQLAQAVFDDSTASALRFYSNKGHPEYNETAEFISIIASWWKTVNVKSKFHGSRKREALRDPITQENLVEKTSFLRGFVDWLSAWEDVPSEPKRELSRETFLCSKHTSAALASLAEFLINEKGFDFFLTGKAQSDKIENRFGKSRQMSGGNLYASVRQFLESDRILKIKNLAKLNRSIAEIKEIVSDANKVRSEVAETLSEQIASSMLEDEPVDLSPSVVVADANILFYVAGRFSRSLCYNTDCVSCKDRLVAPDCEAFELSVVNFEENTPETNTPTEFLEQVNRGGLTIPSELSFLTCIQAWKFYSKILEEPGSKKLLFSPNVSSQILFQKSLVKFLSSTEETKSTFLTDKCQDGHCFEDFASSFFKKIFNLFSKNYVSVANSEIHAKKSRMSNDTKRDSLGLKISKLQSNQM